MISFYFINQNMGQKSLALLQSALARFLTKRGLALTDEGGDFYVRVTVDQTLKNDRYVIESGESGVLLTAANDRAVYAALGRFLAASRFDGRGGFVPFSGRIEHTPRTPLRGIYFATHFYNFYQNAPLERVYEVIEDLAMRGCNCIAVWFDMHHYRSVKEPAAKELIDRLRAIIGHANAIGMQVAITQNANEAFMDSPEALRARWDVNGAYKAELQGHYHLELCPSKQGGIEQIIAYCREVLACLADLCIDYVMYWPYDQGGCTCPDCSPWGANGFLKLFPHFKALVKELMPHAKLIVSTWYFDKFIDGEWDAFYPQMAGPLFEDVEFFMAFFRPDSIPACIQKSGIPKGKKFLEFPEISMQKCYPWGGFGASVLADSLQKSNSAGAHLYGGCLAYSEGIYEDVNKFIELAHYDGSYADAKEAVRAYVKLEFCCEDEALTEAVLRSETGLRRKRHRAEAPSRHPIENPADVDLVYETLTRYNEILPEGIKSGYKFRLLYLRAVIDYELKYHDYVPTASPRCTEAMEEIDRIYFASERTRSCVRPPLFRSAEVEENV